MRPARAGSRATPMARSSASADPGGARRISESRSTSADAAGAAQIGYNADMCRNIRTLHHFEPPTTPDEIRAASLQFVRKVSGLGKPAREDEVAFARAVEQVTKATTALLAALPVRGTARTREGERDKARLRWTRREIKQPT